MDLQKHFSNVDDQSFQTLRMKSFYPDCKHQIKDVVHIIILTFFHECNDILLVVHDNKCECILLLKLL